MKDWRKADAEQRARLERMSSGGQRADVCNLLNKIAAGDASALPGLGAYALLMAAQARGRLKGENERLDRLHPGSGLRRRKAAGGADGAEEVISVEDMSRLARQAWRNRFF